MVVLAFSRLGGTLLIISIGWSMPAGKTTGSLDFNGSKVIVDTEKSLTWYDRQWAGAPAN